MMRFQTLAETFARLEETSSRLRIIELLADLFRRLRPTEIEPAVYLLLGQLRPPYEGVEAGVGEKLLTAALAAAYGVSEATVVRRFKRAGDLGLVAEALAPAAPRRRLSLRQAYQGLLDVAGATGAGSLGRKTALLAAALSRVGPLEAKFLVRAAQGRLRLGVGDQTILEAGALAALGNRAAKKRLEHAFNVRSDLAGVLRVAFETGERGLAAIEPRIGVPVRPALAQRLPSAAAIIARLGAVQVEPKYDGFRLQMHRDGRQVWAFSRRLENVTAMFPELADGVRRQLKATRAIIEGEAVGYNPETGEFLPFQLTMTRKRKTGVAEAAERYPVRLFAFDLLYAGNRNYIPRPQRERSRRLRALLPFSPSDRIAVSETRIVRSVDELETCFDEMIERGLEGILAKRPDAPYQAGVRGYQWVKLKRAYQSKLRDTVDLVLVGYLRGRGRRAVLGIGSLLGAVYDPEQDRFRTVAKIGSGLSEAGWKDLRARLDRHVVRARPARVDALITPDVWVEPKYVVEVLADEITRSPSHTCGKSGDEPGYALRFPRMVSGIRADKAPADATSEREILDLYRQQRRRRR
ncbi:MAG TPA: ATP-dependent DNA ligase [Gemmatimonadales bacterium]|nr:ATP-dependent DNA ligase [Gemmatimonadales bacterium]